MFTTRRIIPIVGLTLAAVFSAILFSSPGATADRMRADRILVLKGARQLVLYKGDETLKVYRISLGWQPEGAKTRRGDGRTPEGKYTIDSHNPYSKYHLALHVSYPDSNDVANARRAGVDPGGNIMIHGLPNGHGAGWAKRRFTDWTAGCIAVSDKEIEEIYRAVPDGTPIEIRP